MTDSNDFGKEVGLVHRAIVTGRKVGADRSFWIRLSEDEKMFRRVVKMVCGEKKPQPTITFLEFTDSYRTFRREYKTLVAARDAMGLNGCVAQDVNDTNFPPESCDDKRKFALVCFHRHIDDHEDPAKSELLRELDKLGLRPEGPMELCFVVTRDLPQKYPIVARRQVGRFARNGLFCPILHEDDDGLGLSLDYIGHGWDDCDWFLASCK